MRGRRAVAELFLACVFVSSRATRRAADFGDHDRRHKTLRISVVGSCCVRGFCGRACALRWAVGSSGCVGAVARVRRFRPESGEVFCCLYSNPYYTNQPAIAAQRRREAADTCTFFQSLSRSTRVMEPTPRDHPLLLKAQYSSDLPLRARRVGSVAECRRALCKEKPHAKELFRWLDTRRQVCHPNRCLRNRHLPWAEAGVAACLRAVQEARACGVASPLVYVAEGSLGAEAITAAAAG